MNIDFFKIDQRLIKIADEAEAAISLNIASRDKIAEYNGQKVLSAFIDNKVSEICLKGSTGYGYGDIGRDKLDKVFAQITGSQDALVRHNFVSGTHALSVALFGILRPGDRLVSVTGAPYDTLEEIIGIRGQAQNGSLKDFGVEYGQLDLLYNGKPDLDGVAQIVRGSKVCYIQRSRGYSLRPSITVDEIGEIVEVAKAVNPQIIIMVDNCYGEFVERQEPTNVGADIIVGSLIKNPGGGIARTGGYIAGKRELIELCSYRLTCLGMGKEVGCTLDQNRELYMGLFMAPDVVSNAVKTATFSSELFSRLGFECYPKRGEIRSDIITAIKLNSPKALTAFCRGIQKGAPIDSFVTPEPWDMPGYDSQVIMAAGAFTMGASIELSADAPLREPYAVWVQGGMTYPSGKIGIMLAAQEMLDQGVLTIYE